MKATVYSIKASKRQPDVNEVIALQVSETVPTILGDTKVSKFYNVVVAKGSSELGEGQEIDLPMESFDVKESRLDNGTVSYWLEPKL